MACHGVISAGVYQRRIRLLTKLEITAPSFSNHSRYGTGDIVHPSRGRLVTHSCDSFQAHRYQIKYLLMS